MAADKFSELSGDAARKPFPTTLYGLIHGFGGAQTPFLPFPTGETANRTATTGRGSALTPARQWDSGERTFNAQRPLTRQRCWEFDRGKLFA